MWIYKAAEMSRAKDLLPSLPLTNTKDDVDIAWQKWVKEFVTIMDVSPRNWYQHSLKLLGLMERLERTLLDEKDSIIASNPQNHRTFYRDINS